ncbi:MAG TPA: caspase family protein [Caulobacteraceae bacterium]|nr:caspase family protein [Caulobacteraceae bacterium]
MSAAPVEARRLALVIGNGQYANADPLANPERDVDAVADRLRALHVEVAESKDVRGDTLRSQIISFKHVVADGDTVIIYYAGYGMEVRGRDYLLPVDADIQNIGDVSDWGYDLSGLFFTDKHNVAVIMIFDACRDNSFLRRTRSNMAGTSVINVPAGDMVIFSAGAGEVALDGDPGAAPSAAAPQNSLFASALLSALTQPNLDDRDLFVEVRRQVQAHSNQQQNPQIIGALNAKFVFNEGASSAPTSYAAAPPPAPSEAPVEVAAATQAPSEFASPAPPPVAIPTYAPPPPSPPLAPTMIAPLAVAPPPAVAPAPAPPLIATAPPPPSVASPAIASLSVAVPVAAAPVQAIAAPAPPPQAEPMQVASLSGPAPPAAGGYGPSVVETAVPSQPGVFTIASLGMNRMPRRPDLTPVPPINLPANFCSAQERNVFHDDVYKPAWRIANNNNDLAIKYLDALNALHREYSELQSGYANAITHEYNDYAPIASEAFTTGNKYTNLHEAIMAIPVGTCK